MGGVLGREEGIKKGHLGSGEGMEGGERRGCGRGLGKMGGG